MVGNAVSGETTAGGVAETVGVWSRTASSWPVAHAETTATNAAALRMRRRLSGRLSRANRVNPQYPFIKRVNLELHATSTPRLRLRCQLLPAVVGCAVTPLPDAEPSRPRPTSPRPTSHVPRPTSHAQYMHQTCIPVPEFPAHFTIVVTRV